MGRFWSANEFICTNVALITSDTDASDKNGNLKKYLTMKLQDLIQFMKDHQSFCLLEGAYAMHKNCNKYYLKHWQYGIFRNE